MEADQQTTQTPAVLPTGELAFTPNPDLINSVPTVDSVKKKRNKPGAGRPLKFKTVEELQQRIDAYFADCNPHPEEYFDYEYPLHEKSGRPDYSQEKIEVPKIRWTEQKPYTVSGLASFLNTSRETLMNYEGKKKYFDAIKAAKDKCARYSEDYLYSGKNVTGAIFSLKANFGFREEDPDDNPKSPLDLPGGLHFHNHVESKKNEYAE